MAPVSKADEHLVDAQDCAARVFGNALLFSLKRGNHFVEDTFSEALI